MNGSGTRRVIVKQVDLCVSVTTVSETRRGVDRMTSRSQIGGRDVRDRGGCRGGYASCADRMGTAAVAVLHGCTAWTLTGRRAPAWKLWPLIKATTCQERAPGGSRTPLNPLTVNDLNDDPWGTPQLQRVLECLARSFFPGRSLPEVDCQKR